MTDDDGQYHMDPHLDPYGRRVHGGYDKAPKPFLATTPDEAAATTARNEDADLAAWLVKAAIDGWGRLDDGNDRRGHTAMTDKDIAAMRADAAEAARVLDGTLTIGREQVAALAATYAERYARLMPRLLAEVERWRALGRQLAELDDTGLRYYPSTIDAVIEKARALLAGEGEAKA